jgi:hypothetical protein
MLRWVLPSAPAAGFCCSSSCSAGRCEPQTDQGAGASWGCTGTAMTSRMRSTTKHRCSAGTQCCTEKGVCFLQLLLLSHEPATTSKPRTTTQHARHTHARITLHAQHRNAHSCLPHHAQSARWQHATARKPFGTFFFWSLPSRSSQVGALGSSGGPNPPGTPLEDGAVVCESWAFGVVHRFT